MAGVGVVKKNTIAVFFFYERQSSPVIRQRCVGLNEFIYGELKEVRNLVNFRVCHSDVSRPSATVPTHRADIQLVCFFISHERTIRLNQTVFKSE